MAPPQFLFKRAFDRLKVDKSRIRYMSRENVVMHVATAPVSSRPSPLRVALGTAFFKTSRPPPPTLQSLSSADLDSPFSHLRFNSGLGRILFFKKFRNIIRAGKATHADSLYGCIAFILYLNQGWYTSIAAPNSVLSGQFKTLISEAVKTDFKAAHTSKFPGISIATPGSACPELYLRRGNFIIPGISRADQLSETIEVLNSVHAEYGITTAPEETPLPARTASPPCTPPPS